MWRRVSSNITCTVSVKVRDIRADSDHDPEEHWWNPVSIAVWNQRHWCWCWQLGNQQLHAGRIQSWVYLALIFRGTESVMKKKKQKQKTADSNAISTSKFSIAHINLHNNTNNNNKKYTLKAIILKGWSLVGYIMDTWQVVHETEVKKINKSHKFRSSLRTSPHFK